MSSRPYLKSHPWLTFKLPSERFTSRLWLLLGEATSKIDHLAGTPLRPDVAKQLNTISLAKGAQATAAIEGNSLTEEEAGKVLSGEITLPVSKKYLGIEIENVARCYLSTWERVVVERNPPLTRAEIENFNRELLAGLDHDDHVTPGIVRRVAVGVSGYRGAPAEDCVYLLDRLVEWLNSESFQDKTLGHVPAILAAVIAHLYIAWIHPFGDGNGRTARMVETSLLVKSGVPQPATTLLSNHYNNTRSDYYRHLDRASKEHEGGAGVVAFIEYAVQGLVDQLREQILSVQAYQLEVAWQNYVHEQFRHATEQKKRQRDLVLALSEQREGVPLAKLPYMSEVTMKAYEVIATKSRDRTLRRDVNALKERNLLVETGTGYRVNIDIMRAFLPVRSSSLVPPSRPNKRRNG